MKIYIDGAFHGEHEAKISVSYGLSSLLVNLMAIGLLLSVAARKHRVMF